MQQLSLRKILPLVTLFILSLFACVRAHEVTAFEYCNFLNQTAASDPDHLFDKKMETDPEAACIARVGTPGNFHYEVIAGRENFPVAYVNELGEESYCDAMGFSRLSSPSHIICHGVAAADETDDSFLTSNHGDFSIASSSVPLLQMIGGTAVKAGAEVTSDAGLEELGLIGLAALLGVRSEMETPTSDLPPSASTDNIGHTLPEADPRAEEKPTEVKKPMSTSPIGTSSQPPGLASDLLAADAKTTLTELRPGAVRESKGGVYWNGTPVTAVDANTARNAVLTAEAEAKYTPGSSSDSKLEMFTQTASSEANAGSTTKGRRLRTEEEMQQILAEKREQLAAHADTRAIAIISRIKDGYFYTKAKEAEEAVTKYAPGTHEHKAATQFLAIAQAIGRGIDRPYNQSASNLLSSAFRTIDEVERAISSRPHFNAPDLSKVLTQILNAWKALETSNSEQASVWCKVSDFSVNALKAANTFPIHEYEAWKNAAEYLDQSLRESDVTKAADLRKASKYHVKAAEAYAAGNTDEAHSLFAAGFYLYKSYLVNPEHSLTYQKISDFYAKSAQAYSAGNTLEAYYLQETSDYLHLSLKQSNHTRAADYQKASDYYAKAAQAIAAGNKDEARNYFNAAINLKDSLQSLPAKEAEECRTLSNYHVKAAEAFGAGNTDEATNWQKAADYMRQSLRKLGATQEKEALNLRAASKCHVKAAQAFATGREDAPQLGRYYMSAAKLFSEGNSYDAESVLSVAKNLVDRAPK